MVRPATAEKRDMGYTLPLLSLQPSRSLRASRARRAFTFIEVMVVVVIIGILAAMVVPRFANAQSDAKLSAMKATLGDMRGAIANFYANSIIAGSPAYPTQAQLEALFTSGDVPRNPINGKSGIEIVSDIDDAEKRVTTSTTAGWRYFYDNSSNPPVAILYANDASFLFDPAIGANQYVNEY